MFKTQHIITVKYLSLRIKSHYNKIIKIRNGKILFKSRIMNKVKHLD